MAPAPAPAPAVDVEDEGGAGAKRQSNMAVVKSEDICTGSFKNGGALLVPCSSPVGGRPVVAPESLKDDGGDTTECSSSFGDTCSGFDDEVDGGEPEVNSAISAHYDGYGPSKPPSSDKKSRIFVRKTDRNNLVTKKKVTAEWRNAVRPILWRCQWLELRMKDLSSQVSKYDRELAQIKKEKELQQAVSKANDSMSESMQIHKGHGNSIMKRRKRKKHEDNVDTSLYINKHQILSYYYDKQNKGAETDGLVIDDDCGSPVDGSIRGGLDTVALLDAENYDMIFEQLALKDILLTIDGVQSQVHLLQDRLSKAHSEGANLAFSEDNTHLRVARKRHSTQKRSFSYTKCRFTKPQKKKNLNILLKDGDGPDLAVRRPLSDRETDALINNANRNAAEKSGECNHPLEKAITVDLLLGTDNSIPNGHMGDLCKEDTDDILIDNQAANEGSQQFEKVKHLPTETSSRGQNISAPAEVKNTCAPAEDNTFAPAKLENASAPVVKQESFLEKSPMMKPVCPEDKMGQKLKKKKKGSFSTKKQSKEASTTPAAKNKTGSTPSAAEEKSESTSSAAAGPETMTARSAGKKRKSGNKWSSAKKRKIGNSSSTEKKQENGKSSSASKKRKTENSSSAEKKQKTESSSVAAKKQESESSSLAAKKQKTENSPSAAKKPETGSTPSQLKIEKAVLVAVNSRRSQRVRKPKVFTE